MLIHIGMDNLADDKELVAIISSSGMTEQLSAYMENKKSEGRFTPCEGEKSYILLHSQDGERIQASCIRSATLKQRFLIRKGF